MELAAMGEFENFEEKKLSGDETYEQYVVDWVISKYVSAATSQPGVTLATGKQFRLSSRPRSINPMGLNHESPKAKEANIENSKTMNCENSDIGEGRDTKVDILPKRKAEFIVIDDDSEETPAAKKTKSNFREPFQARREDGKTNYPFILDKREYMTYSDVEGLRSGINDLMALSCDFFDHPEDFLEAIFGNLAWSTDAEPKQHVEPRPSQSETAVVVGHLKDDILSKKEKKDKQTLGKTAAELDIKVQAGRRKGDVARMWIRVVEHDVKIAYLDGMPLVVSQQDVELDPRFNQWQIELAVTRHALKHIEARNRRINQQHLIYLARMRLFRWYKDAIWNQEVFRPSNSFVGPAEQLFQPELTPKSSLVAMADSTQGRVSQFTAEESHKIICELQRLVAKSDAVPDFEDQSNAQDDSLFVED